jgi:hypothetical protein
MITPLKYLNLLLSNSLIGVVFGQLEVWILQPYQIYLLFLSDGILKYHISIHPSVTFQATQYIVFI